MFRARLTPAARDLLIAEDPTGWDVRILRVLSQRKELVLARGRFAEGVA
jgi:hypothetical protein